MTILLTIFYVHHICRYIVGLRVVPDQPGPAAHIPPVRAHRGHLRSRYIRMPGLGCYQVCVHVYL